MVFLFFYDISLQLVIFPNLIIMKNDIIPVENDIFYQEISGDFSRINIIKCNYNLLIYCEAGCATIEINYRKYNITPHSTLMLMYMDIVSCIYHTSDFRAKALFIAPLLIAPELRGYDFTFLSTLKRHPLTVWNGKRLSFIKQLFDIVATSNELGNDEVFRKCAVSQCFCYVNMLKCYFQENDMLKGDAEITLSGKKDYFAAFVKELFNSYRQSREVLFYAECLKISSNYLNEVCQSVCEHSAKEVIDHYISSQLKFELYNTDKSMQQLAEEYNFPNQSYLSRYYRRVMGESPTDTRKNRSEKKLLIF